MSFRVISNAKMPEGRNAYPWDRMRVGDSFLVPYTEKDHGRHSKQNKSLRATVSRAGRTRNQKFSVRVTDAGYRIWRIK